MSDVGKDISVVDLFETIDNVSNSNDKNDKIINKVKDKMVCIFLSLMNKKRKREERKEVIRRYKIYLNDFKELIEQQIDIINGMFDNGDAQDMLELYIKMKNELTDYAMKIYKLDLLNISGLFDKKEQGIYQSIHVFDFLDKYYDTCEKVYSLNINQEGIVKKDIEKQQLSFSSNWKTYFYLSVSLEKQRKYNETIISYCMPKNNQTDNTQIYLKKGSFYTADFQGQFAKNICCHRKQLKLTQQQLSERSGVDRTMIAKVEKLRQPTTLETAIRLLTSLNLGLAIYPIADARE